MEAFFDRTNHPRIKLIVGGRKHKQSLIALIDSGFDGFVSLPITIAIQLGLELVSMERVQYADGRVANELVFTVDVELEGKTRSVPTTLTNSIEALAGTALFVNNKVLFNFPGKRIDIT